MNKLNIKIVLCLAFLSFSFLAKAQCDKQADQCDIYLGAEFLSDGQEYRALLHGDQEAEFTSTLFGGNTYRIAACSGDKSGELIFNVKDSEGNVLFNSLDFGGAPFWDFVVENTLEVTISAHLDQNKKDSGCAVILIGFQ
jgi:hypothetical protein